MWPWHSPLKYSHVWVKTSICLPEQHLHSAWSQAVLTSTASDLHSRGNQRKRQMQLSSLKTSQDREDSVLTLAEQNLKSIFSDPLLQRPEVFTLFSPVPASQAAVAPPAALGIQNNISFLISCQTSVDETWPVSPHAAGPTHGKSQLSYLGVPFSEGPGTQAHDGGMNNMGCCCHLLVLMEQWALSQCGSCMLDVTAGSYPTREGKSLHGKEMEWKRIRNGKIKLNY